MPNSDFPRSIPHIHKPKPCPEMALGSGQDRMRYALSLLQEMNSSIDFAYISRLDISVSLLFHGLPLHHHALTFSGPDLHHLLQMVPALQSQNSAKPRHTHRIQPCPQSPVSSTPRSLSPDPPSRSSVSTSVLPLTGTQREPAETKTTQPMEIQPTQTAQRTETLPIQTILPTEAQPAQTTQPTETQPIHTAQPTEKQPTQTTKPACDDSDSQAFSPSSTSTSPSVSSANKHQTEFKQVKSGPKPTAPSAPAPVTVTNTFAALDDEFIPFIVYDPPLHPEEVCPCSNDSDSRSFRCTHCDAKFHLDKPRPSPAVTCSCNISLQFQCAQCETFFDWQFPGDVIQP
jgi:hypothetical protein